MLLGRVKDDGDGMLMPPACTEPSSESPIPPPVRYDVRSLSSPSELPGKPKDPEGRLPVDPSGRPCSDVVENDNSSAENQLGVVAAGGL